MPIILTPYVQQKAASKDFVGKDFNYASSGYGIIESGSMVGKNVTYVVKGSSPEAAFGAMFARSQYNHPWVGSGANADQYMTFDAKDVNQVFVATGSSPEAAFGAMFVRSEYNHPWSGSGANADQYMVFDGKATENAFTVQGAGVQ